MPLTTYAELQTEVTDWLHRSDLAAKVPVFIQNAENVINRRLHIVPVEEETNLVAQIGSRFVALPADFGSPVSLQSPTIEPRHEFTPIMVEQMRIDDLSQGLPVYWAIDGANIAFEKNADAAYPLRLRYWKTVYLSNTSPTNEIYARAPDLYLYGALAQAAPYIVDDARLPMWEATFRRLLAEVATDTARSKTVAPLRTEIPQSLYAAGGTRRGWRY